MTPTTRVDASTLPDERWDDLARGTIRFRTLISAPNTATTDLVCGVAMLAPGETFALHWHTEPEVYFGLEGTGEVLIDGSPHSLGPGVALYIPGGAVHGVPVAKTAMTWFYTFATDRFADIRYRFLHESSE